MALGTRAISRVQGSGGSFSDVKKLVDLYVSTNTDETGEVKDPGVYQYAIDKIIAPYAGTIDGQNLIADYSNRIKKLNSAKSDSETTVAALRQKEYSAWYVDDDGEDNTSFRNPSWVAQVTSDSLDMILAESLDIRDKRAADGKDVSDIDGYIRELSTRADRMRSVSTQLQDGGAANLDGYGYYVDSDPNTGVIRGASFMPTDVNFQELAKNTIRTDSMVTVNGKKVPVYLPYVKTADGETKAMFGGTEYTGDSNLLSGGEADVAFTDRAKYQHALSAIENGKVYETFTGKTNQDGSYKKDYLYVSPENKVYRFGEDDPKGKELIDSLQGIGGHGTIQRLSPADVNQFYTEPLPDDSQPLVRSATHDAKMQQFARDQQGYDAEVQRLRNQNSLGAVVENAPGVVSNFVKGAAGVVSSFFGRKNALNKPDQAGTSINGQPSGNDVTAAGAGFFRNKA